MNDNPRVQLLLVMHTSWSGSNEFSCPVQRDRLESLRIVRTDGGTNDKEESLVWGRDSESPLRAD